MLSNFNLLLRQLLKHPDDDTLALIATDAGMHDGRTRLKAELIVDAVLWTGRWLRLVRQMNDVLCIGHPHRGVMLTLIARRAAVPIGCPLKVRIRVNFQRPLCQRYVAGWVGNRTRTAVVSVGVRWLMRWYSRLTAEPTPPLSLDVPAGGEGEVRS